MKPVWCIANYLPHAVGASKHVFGFDVPVCEGGVAAVHGAHALAYLAKHGKDGVVGEVALFEQGAERRGAVPAEMLQ